MRVHSYKSSYRHPFLVFVIYLTCVKHHSPLILVLIMTIPEIHDNAMQIMDGYLHWNWTCQYL